MDNKLIPPNVTVTEQFRIRKNIIRLIFNWSGSDRPDDESVDIKLLEEASGIKCSLSECGRLTGFEVVDNDKFLLFSLKYSGKK